MKEYKSVLLEEEEVNAIKDLEKISNDIKIVEFNISFYIDNKWNVDNDITIWYEDHHVVALMFYHFGEKVIEIPESLENFTNLRFLYFLYTDFNNFPLSFKNLRNLEHLDFYYYQESSGAPDEIYFFPNLEFPDTFKELINLKKISIYGDFNVYFPPSFFDIPNLEELELAWCSCTSIHSNYLKNTQVNPSDVESWKSRYGCNLPEDFGKINSLKKLVLEDLIIKALPKSIINLPILKELHIKYSHSSWLKSPKNIKIIFEIKSLEKLIFHRCKFEVFPESIINLTNLKEIEFKHYHFISEKPRNFERIFKIKSLKKVTINGFGKEIISDSIGNLINLKELNISHNHMQNFPVEIIKCQKIEFLDLTLNNFKSELTQLNELPNLNHLIISNKHQNLIPKNLYSKKNLKIEFKQ